MFFNEFRDDQRLFQWLSNATEEEKIDIKLNYQNSWRYVTIREDLSSLDIGTVDFLSVINRNDRTGTIDVRGCTEHLSYCKKLNRALAVSFVGLPRQSKNHIVISTPMTNHLSCCPKTQYLECENSMVLYFICVYI